MTRPLTLSKRAKPIKSWIKYLLKKPANMARRGLAVLLSGWYKVMGVKFLDKIKTVIFLRIYRVSNHPQKALLLPEVVNPQDIRNPVFPATQALIEPVFVWRYTVNEAKAKQLPYGGIMTADKILCLDANTDDFYRNTLHRQKRETIHTKILIAPWSHYLDGFMWGGYYDFVILVAGKLCRMKDTMSASDFTNALVSYPLFDTTYEREYLALLGIQPERVLDSRRANVTFEECILGNIGHWFYPNAADVRTLRHHILTKMPPAPPKRNRIYISRSGRRRIVNERELIMLLKNYDFQIIDDTPRSVADQVAIYQQASFIIGPHGASFTNILWCEPGTHLFELFSPTYIPGFFRYLAHLLDLSYSAYYHGPIPSGDWAKGLNDDMYVSISELERCLDRLFVKT